MKSSAGKFFYKEMECSISNHESINCKELSQLVDEYLRNGDNETATFWAEKLLALNQEGTLYQRLDEIAYYLSVLTAARAWQTIIALIERHELFARHIVFAFFNINALFQRGMFCDIIGLPIGQVCCWENIPYIRPDNATRICVDSEMQNNCLNSNDTIAKLDAIADRNKYESRLLLLLAKTYLMVQNRPAAIGCLRHCLTSNPYNSEAIYLAIDSCLLKVEEVRELVNTSKTSLNTSGTQVINYLLDIYNKRQTSPLATSFSCRFLKNDLSLRAATALQLYNNGYIQETYQITSEIFHEYGYYNKCFLVHVGCLVHLYKISELFQLGHSMVKLQPEREITWYTVGCYYYATRQYSTAKKFLNKCTMIDSGFGEGWLAYGHALFYVEEHEQAMNCYLRASRIMEGHFEPMLYIAVEYCFANNFNLAHNFLRDAEDIAGANAIILHEKGTALFMENRFDVAKEVLMNALQILTKCEFVKSLNALLSIELSDFWEPLLNNLGHILRKLQRYEDAITLFRKSLLLGATKAEAWACIGICYASLASETSRKNKVIHYIDLAMEAFNKSLAIRPGDDLVKMALDKVIQFAADHSSTDFFIDLNTNENLDTFVDQIRKKGSTPRSWRASTKAKGLDEIHSNMIGNESEEVIDNKFSMPLDFSTPIGSSSQL